MVAINNYTTIPGVTSNKNYAFTTANPVMNTTGNSSTEDITLRHMCLLNDTSSYAFAAVLMLMSLVGVVLNGSVLAALIKYKKLQTNSVILIGALATLDLLTSSIVIPLYVIDLVIPTLKWQRLTIVLLTMVVTLSLLTVVYISFDRFAHVYYLQLYNVSRKKLLVGLFLFLLLPFLLFLIIPTLAGRIRGGNAGKSAGRITGAVFFALCISCIACAYGGIVIILRRHAKAMSKHLGDNQVQTQTRASKTSLIIVVAVVLMNTPALFYSIVISTGGKSMWGCTITLATLFGSSPLNPVIYCLRMPEMRRHILSLFCCHSLDDEDSRGRERIVTERTREESVSVDRNISVIVDKKKDNSESIELLKLKNDNALDA